MADQRRLAAIMFTDMVGYSALAQRNETVALELVEEQFKLLRPIISTHEGREIKSIGDAILAEFLSPLQAVRCAIAIQKMLSMHNASALKERQILIRIGIHLGDIVHRGDDILGDGVNIASRIEPLADAGGICISQQVYDHVHNKLDVSLASIGKPTLKNIATPMEIYKAVLPWQQGSSLAPTSLRKQDTSGRPSIAVLPFVNISADPDNEYFSDGITEDIITHLSKVRALKVISRTSIMQYKQTTKKLKEIGTELGVSSVLEGSVRKAGNKVRIAAQLVNAETDEHLWAETYDRELTDIFAIQSDVAQQIVQALQAEITAAEKKHIEKRSTENLEAYQLYLKGRFFWNKRDEESLKKGIEYFQQALTNDPSYALAYSGLSDSFGVLGWHGFIPPVEAFRKAKASAEKALEINDALGEARASLAYAKMNHDWDWPAIEAEFKRALELNPGYATAHHWYALMLMQTGRIDESLAKIKMAQEYDPLSLIINMAMGWMLYFARRYEQAKEALQKALELNAGFYPTHLVFGAVCLQEARYNEAIVEFQKAASLSGGIAYFRAWLAYAYAMSGKPGVAREILEELMEQSNKKYVASSGIALIYLGLRETDQVFRWLERAYEERDHWLTWINVEPQFDRLRSDLRFTALLKKLRLEPI